MLETCGGTFGCIYFISKGHFAAIKGEKGDMRILKREEMWSGHLREWENEWNGTCILTLW